MVYMKPPAVQVLAPPRGTVPYPLLKENTLVLSDQMTLLRRRGGRLELSARVGDVYPNQARRRLFLAHFYVFPACGPQSIFAVLRSCLVKPSLEHGLLCCGQLCEAARLANTLLLGVH